MALLLPEDNFETRTSAPCATTDTDLYLNTLPTKTSGVLSVFDIDNVTLLKLVYYTGVSASPSNHLTGVVQKLALVDSAGVVAFTSAGSDTDTIPANSRIAMCPGIHYVGVALAVLNGDMPMGGVMQLPATRVIDSARDVVDKEYTDAAAATAGGITAFYVTKNGADPTLTINIGAGTFMVGNQAVTFAGASAQAVTVSQTNYVMISPAAAVVVNTTGFVAGNIPVATVVCDGTTITSVNDKRSWLTLASDLHDYAADAGSTDTYAITVTPALTAYVTGQVFTFKANTLNTGACTLNVSGLGAKSIVKSYNLALETGDIKANQLVMVQYDGTNMQMISDSAFIKISQDGHEIYAADAGANDTYVITLAPVPAAYVTGMVVNFKANTINTGACTINVNGLGAKSIVKSYNVALEDGDIKAGQDVQLIYDGTNFQMLSPIANSFTFKTGTDATWAANAASGTINIAHGLGKIPKIARISASFNGNPKAAQSQGSYDGTTNACTYAGWVTNSTTTSGGVAAAIVYIYDAASAGTQSATATVDATNIILTTTKGGLPTGSAINLKWEVEG